MLAKRSALALALTLVGVSLGVPERMVAQTQPPAVNQKAATPDELNTYMGMAAISMCTLSQTKVPFGPSLDANLNMLVAVLTSKHGSQVPGSQGALTREQLTNGSVAQLVLRVDAMCGTKLPADWKKELDPIVSRVKQALQSSGQGSNK